MQQSNAENVFVALKRWMMKSLVVGVWKMVHLSIWWALGRRQSNISSISFKKFQVLPFEKFGVVLNGWKKLGFLLTL